MCAQEPFDFTLRGSTICPLRGNVYQSFDTVYIIENRKRADPSGQPFSLSKKQHFNSCALCDSTHKIEFAEQIHKFRGRVPRNLYKGRKNVPARRGFSSEFDRKRGFDREAARKTLVFRQPQTAFTGGFSVFQAQKDESKRTRLLLFILQLLRWTLRFQRIQRFLPRLLPGLPPPCPCGQSR